VSRKIDFEGRDWAAHAQDHWLEFAGNSNFPDYLRVTFVAYGRHAANGHAKLERGELAAYLIRKDGTLPERRVVWRAIETAARLGYLMSESRLLCLVVSSHDIQGGRGSADARCTRDHTTRQKTNVRSDRGRFATNVRNDARRSTTNVRNDCGRSSVAPLSLLQTATHHDDEPEVSA
jgi:hypothetical protein